MFQYRVTKYSPEERAGTVPSWTSISDLGNSYGGTVFTEDAYLETEQKYLSAIRRFASAQEVTALRIDRLTIDSDSPWWQRVAKGDQLSVDEAIELSRAVLREESVWCTLVVDGEFFVHFGYDYYMYIGIARPSDQAVLDVRRSGLHVDEFESPYLD
ncbi:hypothetical protein TR51_02015 [Kitasatospora griseola]|uniref:Uncharacterized protein n=1 Tax=Kitasatospora griseola TaxID=2064 RepID=A0A0D0P447_KITGR|nr:hypothetical protein [Kitasatospora griseola]KIQ66411.1 hypothetical protein TR51_02015 [Kitasatospora griseola]